MLAVCYYWTARNVVTYSAILLAVDIESQRLLQEGFVRFIEGDDILPFEELHQPIDPVSAKLPVIATVPRVTDQPRRPAVNRGNSRLS